MTWIKLSKHMEPIVVRIVPSARAQLTRKIFKNLSKSKRSCTVKEKLGKTVNLMNVEDQLSQISLFLARVYQKAS